MGLQSMIEQKLSLKTIVEVLGVQGGESPAGAVWGGLTEEVGTKL